MQDENRAWLGMMTGEPSFDAAMRGVSRERVAPDMLHDNPVAAVQSVAGFARMCAGAGYDMGQPIAVSWVVHWDDVERGLVLLTDPELDGQVGE